MNVSLETFCWNNFVIGVFYFCFISFYFSLFLFYFVLFLFCFILFYFISFHFISFHFISFHLSFFFAFYFSFCLDALPSEGTHLHCSMRHVPFAGMERGDHGGETVRSALRKTAGTTASRP